MSKNTDTELLGAQGIHNLLVKNLKGLDAGDVTVDRANAIARVGNTIFQGVRTRLKVQTQAGQGVSDGLATWAK